MSELKARRIIGLDEQCASVDNDYYLKSEADKVIAHHKLKRCLTMAEWCNANCMHTVLLIGHKITPHWEWRIKTNYWYKWRKIWFELYKKFKEGN